MAVKPNIDWYKAESDAPVYNKSPKEKQALIDAPVPSYNKDSVDKEIKRSKQKIGSSESKAIHGLLKGRYANGGEINLKNCKVNTCESNPKCKSF